MGCGHSKGGFKGVAPDDEAMVRANSALRRSQSKAEFQEEGLRISSLNSLNLDRLLDNDAGVKALQAFAETEFAAENVKYWVDAQKYKQMCRASFVKSVAQALRLQAAGSSIIRTYLCDGAPEQLNVASDVLSAFKAPPPDGGGSSFKKSSGGSSFKLPSDSPGKVHGADSVSDGVYTYTDTLFDLVNKGVYQNMRDTFQRFRLSDMAEDLLWAEPLLALDDPAKVFRGNVKVQIKELVKEAQQKCACERISAWAVDGNFTYLIYGTGVGNAFMRLPLGEGLVGAAVRAKDHLVVADAYEHPKFSKEIDEATGYRTKTALCVVFNEDGACRGALQLINKRGEGNEFTEADAAALQKAFQGRFIVLCVEAAETLMVKKAKTAAAGP